MSESADDDGVQVDMESSTYSQGEMVNRIENNIMNSSNYVEKAVEDTKAAIVSQRKAKKKKLWIALCLGIVVLIIAIALGISFS